MWSGTAVDAARVFPLPKSLSFEQGAAVGVPYGTAHRALFGRAAAKKGETVLIHGASGGVGVAAVLAAGGARGAWIADRDGHRGRLQLRHERCARSTSRSHGFGAYTTRRAGTP